jgi:hypothetical protein
LHGLLRSARSCWIYRGFHFDVRILALRLDLRFQGF